MYFEHGLPHTDSQRTRKPLRGLDHEYYYQLHIKHTARYAFLCVI